MRWAVDGAAYVPFIGDGDLAADLYTDRTIYGADLDPDRVGVAARRLGGNIVVADCDQWPAPFAQLEDAFAVADFDSYAYPYHAFRAFWDNTRKAPTVVMFFTDGEKQPLMRTGGHYVAPNGDHAHIKDVQRRRWLFNFYLSRHVWPYFEDYIAPWKPVHYFRYLRGWMAYWGVVVTDPNRAIMVRSGSNQPAG